jgi:hypothetical protein
MAARWSTRAGTRRLWSLREQADRLCYRGSGRRRGQGAAVQPGTTHALTFGGRRGITIPPGTQARSDPARMTVPALTDLAVGASPSDPQL